MTSWRRLQSTSKINNTYNFLAERPSRNNSGDLRINKRITSNWILAALSADVWIECNWIWLILSYMIVPQQHTTS